jgi:hypothetical protein
MWDAVAPPRVYTLGNWVRIARLRPCSGLSTDFHRRSGRFTAKDIVNDDDVINAFLYPSSAKKQPRQNPCGHLREMSDHDAPLAMSLPARRGYAGPRPDYEHLARVLGRGMRQALARGWPVGAGRTCRSLSQRVQTASRI